MHNNLVPGGIYSVAGLNDVYFVYICDFNNSKFNLLEIPTIENTLKKVSEEIKVFLNYYSFEEYTDYINKIDKNSFLEHYNGYLGKVEDWILAELQNAVYLMGYN